MFVDAQSMSLIKSYRIDRRLLSGILHHIWANFQVSVMHIFLYWPISANPLLALCQHSITWPLMTCLKQCLSLAMILCLMIFAIIFVTLITTLIIMLSSLLVINLLFIAQCFLKMFDWVKLSAMVATMNLNNAVDLPKIKNESIGLKRPLMIHLTHFHIWSDSLVVIVKLPSSSSLCSRGRKWCYST